MTDLAIFFGAFAIGIAAIGFAANRLQGERRRDVARRSSTLDIRPALGRERSGS